MSDINGQGFGSEHDWERGHTFPFKVTEYKCRKCPAYFRHRYDDVPDIFKEMEIQKVPEKCEAFMEV